MFVPEYNRSLSDSQYKNKKNHNLVRAGKFAGLRNDIFRNSAILLHSRAVGFVSMKATQLPNSMNNDISILAQFLENLGPEVSGRSSEPLTQEQIEQIHSFAEGNLSEEARESLLPKILENEKALHELVSRLQNS